MCACRTVIAFRPSATERTGLEHERAANGSVCGRAGHAAHMLYPTSHVPSSCRNNIDECVAFFDSRHPGRYCLYNLCSERDYDHSRYGRPHNTNAVTLSIAIPPERSAARRSASTATAYPAPCSTMQHAASHPVRSAQSIRRISPMGPTPVPCPPEHSQLLAALHVHAIVASVAAECRHEWPFAEQSRSCAVRTAGRLRGSRAARLVGWLVVCRCMLGCLFACR